VCLLRGTDWIFIYNSCYVFCVDLRTNSDYFPIQHQLTGLYNRDGVSTARYGLCLYIQFSCRLSPSLLRGTDCVCTYSSAVGCPPVYCAVHTVSVHTVQLWAVPQFTARYGLCLYIQFSGRLSPQFTARY